MTGALRHAPMAATAALLALGLIPARVVAPLKSDQPNRLDTERMERGYYETLLDSGRSLDAAPRVAPSPFDAGRLCDVVSDLREYVLKPNIATSHRGTSWTTNSRGMRDREYATEKPEGVTRIAIVGDSIGAGWGVEDGQGFESRLEHAMNRDSPSSPVEILNFSVPGHAPGQRWEHFRRTGWPLAPDLVIFEATPADLGWDDRRLRVLLPRKLGWDAPQYRDALDRASARPGGTADDYKAVLRPHRAAILANVYGQAVAECRSRGAKAAWVLIPRVGRPVDPAERDSLVAMARSAGFARVIDLSDRFDGIEADDLAIAPNDFHPNARGHAILAEGLRSALATRDGWRTPTEGPR